MASTQDDFFRPYVCPECGPSLNTKFMSQLSLKNHILENHTPSWSAGNVNNRLHRASSGGGYSPTRGNRNSSFLKPPIGGNAMSGFGGRDSDSLSDEVFSDGYYGGADSRTLQPRTSRSPVRVSPAQRTVQRRRRQQQQSNLMLPHGRSPNRNSSGNRLKSARSEPDIQDDFNLEWGDPRSNVPQQLNDVRRPWYDNPQYRGPRPRSTSRSRQQNNSDLFVMGSENGDYRDGRIPRNRYTDENIARVTNEMNRLSMERKAMSLGRHQYSDENERYYNPAHVPRRFEDENKERQWNWAIQLLRDSSNSSSDPSPRGASGDSFEDYMRDLHQRAKSAEREAKQLRNALNSSGQDLTLIPTSAINQNRRSIGGVDEEMILPVNAKRVQSRNKNRFISDDYHYHSDGPADNSYATTRFNNELATLAWPKNKRKQGPRSVASSITDDDRSIGSSSLGGRSPLFIMPASPAIEIQRRCDALSRVFLYLDTKSLAMAGRVCREWYHVSRQPALWKRIRIIRAKLGAKALLQLLRWCTEVESFALETIREIGNPKKATSGFLETSIEKILKANSATIKAVKFVDCKTTVTERILWLTSIHCPKVESVIYVSDTDPVGSEVLWALGKGCPDIIKCVVAPGWPNEKPDKFDDRCCETIAKNWPRLQVACIGSRNLTEMSFLTLALSCPKLRILEIDHGPEITESMAVKIVKIGLRGLERLDFFCTPVTPRAIVQFNSACPKLRIISVHAGISDYYDKKDDPKCQTDFSNLVMLFQKLQSRPGFREVLELKLDYQ